MIDDMFLKFDKIERVKNKYFFWVNGIDYSHSRATKSHRNSTVLKNYVDYRIVR